MFSLTDKFGSPTVQRTLRHRLALRSIATDVQSGEAALETHFREAAAAAVAAHANNGQTAQTQPRRRRRKADPIIDTYLTRQHISMPASGPTSSSNLWSNIDSENTTAPYGSHFIPGYQPHTLLTNPPRPSDVTLELLLASQAHLGHSTSLWNPANSRYIFGIREGIHIISLDITAQHLRRAAKVVTGVAEKGGLILFIGTRPNFDRCVVRAAELASPACHMFERWTPGSITNGMAILGRCGMKVVDEHDVEVKGFEDQLHDHPIIKPDLVVCLNPLENTALLRECAIESIPTIGIIDTDADPTSVTYPIPANDDSIRCVQVIAGVLGRAGQEGQQNRREAAKRGSVTYDGGRGLEVPSDFDFRGWKESRAAREAAGEAGGAAEPVSVVETAETDYEAEMEQEPTTTPTTDLLTRVRASLPAELMQALRSGPTEEQLVQIRESLGEEDFESVLSALEARQRDLTVRDD